MSAILHCVITSIENDRLKQLIENMRYNKKHYEDYVKKELMEDHTIYMDMDMVESFTLLDDLPYYQAKQVLLYFEEDDYLECELGGYHFNEVSKRVELYVRFEMEEFDYTKKYSIVPNGLLDQTFVENYIQKIRKRIDENYDEEYWIEKEEEEDDEEEEVEAWLLDPEKESIQVIKIPKNPDLQYIYKLLHCDVIEYQGFSDGNSHYGIYMDEMGAFKNLPTNKCAKKLLSKIKGIMWVGFTGWYLIFKYDMMSEKQYKLNMDLTPKQFIDKFNRALS